MKFSRSFRGLAVLVLTLLCLFSSKGTVIAVNPSSSNYSTQEYHFGTGGGDQTSTNYKARTDSGALGVGTGTSTNFTGNSGPITPEDEYIEFVVNASTVNLGQQSTGATTTGTATFYVKAYVASGYVVRNASVAPTYNGHTMVSPSSPTASAVGTEQFGINLVANSTGCATPAPANFGANPVQVPSSTYSFGAAATGYNTCGQFKYVNGDIIAQSTKSSGETDYTISYILNISTSTPAGNYTMSHNMVATGTY